MNFRFRIILFGVILCAFACTRPAEKKTPAVSPEPTREICVGIIETNDRNNSGPLQAFLSGESIVNPYSVANFQLYEHPDTASKKLEFIQAFRPLSLLENGGIIDGKPAFDYDPVPIQDSSTIVSDTSAVRVNKTPKLEYWYKVKSQSGKVGYSLAENIARFVFDSKNKKFKYLFSVSGISNNGEPKFRAITYDVVNKKIVSKVFVNAYPEDGNLKMCEINNLVFQGIHSVYRLNANMSYCGGGDGNTYFADTEGGLVVLPDSFVFYDDGGGISSSTVFAPCILPDGSTQLIGDFKLDITDEKPVSIPYPKDSGIPINEILIKIEEEGSYKTNDDNEIITDKKGNAVRESLTTTTTFYRWNGTKVTKVKQLVRKS